MSMLKIFFIFCFIYLVILFLKFFQVFCFFTFMFSNITKVQFFVRWFGPTNYKDIGMLYLIFGVFVNFLLFIYVLFFCYMSGICNIFFFLLKLILALVFEYNMKNFYIVFSIITIMIFNNANF